jgi:hypothetical protein
MTGEEAGLWRAQQKILDQQRDLEGGYRKVGQAGERAGQKVRGAGQEHDKAFGQRAVSQLNTWAASLVSAGAGIATIVSGLREIRDIQKQAAEKALFAQMDIGSLAQLAETPAQMRALRRRAEAIYAAGGAETKGGAARTVFAIESAGAGRDQDALFAEMRATGLVQQPDIMARSAATIISSMGAEEAGTFRDVISKAFGASKGSPALAQALLEATARGGVFAAQAGLSDEELLAATATVSKATGKAETGGTYVSAFVERLAQSAEFQGKTLKQSLQDIEAHDLDMAGLVKLLPRKESRTAYLALSQNLAEYTENLKNVEQAEATDAIGRKLKLAVQHPVDAAAYLRRRETARLELSREELSAKENLAQAASQSYETGVRTGAIEPGGILPTEWQLWLHRQNTAIMSGLYGPGSVLNAAEMAGATEMMDPELQRAIRRSQGKLGQRIGEGVGKGMGSFPAHAPIHTLTPDIPPGHPDNLRYPPGSAPPAVDGRAIGEAAGGMIVDQMQQTFGGYVPPGGEVTTPTRTPRPISPGLAIDR